MRKLIVLSLLLCTSIPALAQKNLSGSTEIQLNLEKLGVLGNVLMIAAHPDDENTALLAWLAKSRKYRTAYLSLTRGEGGQNLIGSEQGDLMGVIRTQELLAARRLDGAEQYFSRAIDFGFSKTAAETFTKWDRKTILGDVVWTIRRFRPDVVILIFSGTARDGHGQHQVSSIIGKEAFRAAADPKQFPEQLAYVEPWQAKRLMMNLPSYTPEMEKQSAATPNTLLVDPGEFDPLLGVSFAEIAGMSRSQHRSQAMGFPERKGAQKSYLLTVDGDAAAKDMFDGVDTTWNRIEGGGKVGDLLAKALLELPARNPEKVLPILMEARQALVKLNGFYASQKKQELDELIVKAAGLWLDATAERYQIVPGKPVKISAQALARLNTKVELSEVTLASLGITQKPDRALAHNVTFIQTLQATFPAGTPYTQPYWLQLPKKGDLYNIADVRELNVPENQPLTAQFKVKVEGQELTLLRPVIFRYVDRVRGELTRPVIIVPPVTLKLSEKALIFPSRSAKEIEVQVTANQAGESGVIKLELPTGWRSTPQSMAFVLTETGEQATVKFNLTPPDHDFVGKVKAIATTASGEVAQAQDSILYEHIPPQAVFPLAEAKLVRADIQLAAKRIGYIMGAGDEVPPYLRQLGAEVVLLSADDLARSDFKKFDAVLTGVRAYNTRPDLRANVQRIFDYVKNGGTYVVQYNVMEGGFFGGDPKILEHVGPYPMKITSARVTEEDAQVEFVASNPLMQWPNLISQKDFDGWIQERGLYYASEYDPKYQSLLSSHDTGEANLTGGTLYTAYGKGHYIFTPLAWFRELPAGVPGAYRIFANLLSAGKGKK